MVPLQEEQHTRIGKSHSNIEHVDWSSEKERLIIQKTTSTASGEDNSDKDNDATHSRRGTFSYLLDDEEFLSERNDERNEKEERLESSSRSCDEDELKRGTADTIEEEDGDGEEEGDHDADEKKSTELFEEPTTSLQNELIPTSEKPIGGESEFSGVESSEESSTMKQYEQRHENVDAVLSTSMASRKREKSTEKRRKQAREAEPTE